MAGIILDTNQYIFFFHAISAYYSMAINRRNALPKSTILIIEDEADIRELTRYNLSQEGYTVFEAATGEEGLEQIQKNSIDLVLLDLMLPVLDGLEVCKRLRNDDETKTIPIIMLTAKGEEIDIVSGLEVGADDYITKPFSPRVLIARIRAILRRNQEDADDLESVIHAHNVTIHPARHEVLVDETSVDLTRTEFELLSYLAKRPGWVRTRGQIVDAVHGDLYPVTERSVDVQVVGLRKKLGQAGTLVETVRGVGYRFRE
jgi:two-component system phosphate regulon response regulator PhoB